MEVTDSISSFESWLAEQAWRSSGVGMLARGETFATSWKRDAAIKHAIQRYHSDKPGSARTALSTDEIAANHRYRVEMNKCKKNKE